MKKSKILRRVSVIALSAAMTASVAFAAAACGGGGGSGTNDEGYRTGTPGASKDPNKITVYIFCAANDAATNKAICENYMQKYNAAHGTNYSVDFSNETDKKEYFDRLAQKWASNDMYDVMYLAPRYVRTYAETGSVLNLADYIDTVSSDPALEGDAAKAANQEVLGEIWSNALSYYAYNKTPDMQSYTRGQPVHYDKEQNGFYTDAGNEEVGLYGLPKDYSNFSTGYNNLFFTEEIKEKMTTLHADVGRSVKGAENDTTDKSQTEGLQFTKASGINSKGKSIIQYAATGPYTNPYTGEAMQATEGESAPIINVGVPTRYFPYNFFRYSSYTQALSKGDPLAVLCEAYTDYDGDGTADGYVVTIPGFPNDEVKATGNNVTDPNAPYDTSVGHITYTYGEYATFIWAMTYYLNTFAWSGGQTDPLDGNGGVKYGDESYKIVFGGEQFEGKTEATVGAVLYLLPWLYANDADLINTANNLCTVRDTADPTKTKGADANIEDPANWRSYVGNTTNEVSKMNLDGSIRKVAMQYGFNSERFLETYGAFLALASDWNGNNGGDSDNAPNGEVNGWSYFRSGRSLFYGAGSWDGGTRNDTKLDRLEFGQMPTPVSENYALYSVVKDVNYTMKAYSNGATEKGTGDAAANDSVQRQDPDAGRIVYDADAVAKNQMLRQDKWGARMDSVGYAVNGQVTNYTGDQAWKKEAAIGITMALTIDPEAQVTLTYAGAQFPNFRYQMEEFVNYQDPKYRETGAFKDMLTPEGFADTTDPEEAARIWDAYYDVALAMESAVKSPSEKGKTVQQFLSEHPIDGQPIKYDTTYASRLMGQLAGSSSSAYLAFAMKILRMVPMTRMTREINIRMQYGLNAVRDSTMYTYTDDWVGYVDARTQTQTMFAYNRAQSITVGEATINANSLEVFRNSVKRNPTQSGTFYYETPLVYALRRAQDAQTELNNNAVAAEQNALKALMQNK